MKSQILTIVQHVISDKTNLFNIGTLAVINLTDLDMLLKIALTCMMLIYTGVKIAQEWKKYKQNDE